MKLACLLLVGGLLEAQTRQRAADALDVQMANDLEARFAVEQAPEFGEAIARVAARIGAGELPRVVVVRGLASEADEMVPAEGRLFVPVELLRRVKDDDELAAMLAHGLAHGTGEKISVDTATIPAFTIWPARSAGAAPMGLRERTAELERKADAAAVESLGRAGLDTAALGRYLERAGAGSERTGALRDKLNSLTAAATPAPPLTSECEVVQALLDDLYGKQPERQAPTLKR